MNAEDKLFGKYNDLALLFIGFLLTSIVGGLIGNFLQQRHWEHQREANLLQSERIAATHVLESCMVLTDKRMYQMQQVSVKIATNDSYGKIEEEFNKYREVLREWNMNLSNNRIFLQRYFGKSTSDIFYDKIHGELKQIGVRLEESYREKKYYGDRDRDTDIGGRLWILRRDVITPFNLKMIKDIQTGNIGIFNNEVNNNN